MCKKKLFNLLFGFFLIGSIGISCTPQKQNIYFQTVPVNSEIQTLITPEYEPKIKVGDLLSINFYSSSNEIGKYNAANDGFLVDKNGNIQLYRFGDIKVEGLTLEQTKQKLMKLLLGGEIFKDLSISTRFRNHHVTILGEVGSPGQIGMETNNLTLIDAIAQKGDLRSTARKDNLLIIRSTDRGKLFFRVNLLDGSIFNSNFYYLQSEDIVYVEPEKAKRKFPIEQVINYGISIVNFILLLSSRIK